MARDCPKGDCVIQAQSPDSAPRSEPRDAVPPERKEALMFLVHFVGDMHQPPALLR